ncbi:MoaD/ThiS family protein [Saccharomonospora iraqiensis]|uniref:MoaD/ThiS family protein n=1 Tax=Saccharomonospora iraqiensis TaxID=52698 RepID=UPI000687F310|nr:MoaD/ThiS family protein [Saccharomonospora iraqiensis]
MPGNAVPGNAVPDDAGTAVTVRVRYFASARAATGLDSEPVGLAGSASVADALRWLRERHAGTGLPRILDAAGFLLDGVAVRDHTRRLPDGAQLDVLPPFAGG